MSLISISHKQLYSIPLFINIEHIVFPRGGGMYKAEEGCSPGKKINPNLQCLKF
jgi:hypothetical protein